MENSEHSKTVLTGQPGALSAGSTSSKPGNGKYAPGDVLGGTYKIIDFLGQGGMGFVYRAEHLMMGKELALKVLRADQVSAVVWRRFQTEAQAIARLDHANIVKIYDMGQSQDGVPYYTMDLLLGESLADYLDREDMLPIERALPIFRQICGGLAYAHDRGIIHRDIKPANIMLVEEAHGSIKIVDFGIAKLSIDGEAGQGLTRPGEIFGSPLYMSPEQCLGLPIDHRTDIYSVGITFFEALTGRAPFIGRSAVETTAMHQSDIPPSLQEIGEIEYPAKLERIVAKMLAKSPEQRYQSLAEAAKDLLLLERTRGRETQIGSTSTKTPRAINRVEQNARQDEDEEEEDLYRDEVELSLIERIKNHKKSLAIAFLAVMSIALTGTVALRATPKPRPVVIVPQPVPVVNYDAVTRTYAEKEDHLFAPEIGPNKPPFSKLIGSGKGAKRHFTIPKGLNLGTIKYGAPDTQCQKIEGSFDLPENQMRELTTSQEATTHSKIFKRFQDGDFQIFTCKTTEGTHDDLIENISHVKSIVELNMSGNDFTNASVPAIAKLTQISTLGIGETSITGETLAATAIPMRLVRLNFENNDNASALVKAMRNSKKAYHLCLAGSNLSGADLETLSTMPNLGKLEIGRSKGIRDEDLKHLTKLTNLRSLELQGCLKLTAGIIPILAKMQSLTYTELSLRPWTEREIQRLGKALPHCTIKNSDTNRNLQNRNGKAAGPSELDPDKIDVE